MTMGDSSRRFDPQKRGAPRASARGLRRWQLVYQRILRTSAAHLRATIRIQLQFRPRLTFPSENIGNSVNFELHVKYCCRTTDGSRAELPVDQADSTA